MPTRAAPGWFAPLAELPRPLWSLIIGNLFSSMGASFYFPMLTLFLREQLDVPMAQIGTLFLAAGLLGAVGAWTGGEWCDRIGRRPIMVLGLSGRAAAGLALAFLAATRGHPALVALCVLLSSMIGQAFQPACEAMLTDIVPEPQRVLGFGLLRIARNAGWAFGPMLGGLLALISYALLFAITAIAFAAAAVLILVLTRESGVRQRGTRFRWRDLVAISHDRLFLAFSAVCALLFCMMGQLVSTLSDFGVEHLRMSKPAMGTIYAINGSLVVLFQYPISRWISRTRFTTALMIGSAIYAIGYGAMVGATGFRDMALLMLLITAGEMIVSPSTLSLAANLSPPDGRGRYLGVFGLFHQIGWSLGPWAGGMALDGFMPHAERAWLLLAGAGALALAGFALLRPWIPRAADGAAVMLPAMKAAPAPSAADSPAPAPGP